MSGRVVSAATLVFVLAMAFGIAGEVAAHGGASASSGDPGEPLGTGASAALEFDARDYRLFNKQIVLPPSAASVEHQFESVLGEKYFGKLATRTTSGSRHRLGKPR